MIFRDLIPATWLCWALYWWLTARNVKANLWRESTASRLLHGAPLVIAFLFLSPGGMHVKGIAARSAPAASVAYWIGAALTAAGLSFAVWARRNLGRNWSGTITIKVDHELITRGPYRIVRHPIYSGILLGFIGSALATGSWRGLVAVILASLAIWRRVYIEEGGMRRTFGAAYDDYAKRVAALVPFLF